VREHETAFITSALCAMSKRDGCRTTPPPSHLGTCFVSRHPPRSTAPFPDWKLLKNTLWLRRGLDPSQTVASTDVPLGNHLASTAVHDDATTSRLHLETERPLDIYYSISLRRSHSCFFAAAWFCVRCGRSRGSAKQDALFALRRYRESFLDYHDFSLTTTGAET
jgi:hypothetical protein